MTLMEALQELDKEIQAYPDGRDDARELLSKFRTTEEDFREFQDRLLYAVMKGARIVGLQTVLEGLVQTGVTIGYNVRVAHEQEDAEARVGQDAPE